MKKLIVFLVGFAILSIGIYYSFMQRQNQKEESENFATWRKFVPNSRLFSVLFPNPPQYAKDFIPIPGSEKKRRYDMYASEKIDGTLFLISVITYPPEIEGSQLNDILRENIDEFMRTRPGNTLTKMLKGNFEEETLDFGFENQEFHIEGRALLKDHIVYMLTYIARKENFDSLEYEHFVNSFRVFNQAQTT